MNVAHRVSWIASLAAFITLLPNAGFAQREEAPRENPAAARIRPALPDDAPLRNVPVSLARSGTELRADFIVPRGALDFVSAMQDSGEIAVSLTVVVGGDLTPLEAVVAADRKSLTWTGNGATLTQEQRDAIERLSLEMELLMLQPGVKPHEEWAWRLSTFWADAPPGFVLNRRVVRAPREEADGPRRGLPEILMADPESQATKSKSKCTKGCNVDSDSKISYLRGKKKNDGCKIGSYTTKHDACVDSTGKGHCYKSYSVKGGCDLSSKCPGRCGPGCGATGFGVYTLDCLEHDYCVGHDNANACCGGDDKCGDEWLDAGDDLLLSAFVNCEGCKK